MLNKELLLTPSLTNNNQYPFLRGQSVRFPRAAVTLRIESSAVLSYARYHYDPSIVPDDVSVGSYAIVESSPYAPNVAMIQQLNNISGYYLPQNSYIIGYIQILNGRYATVNVVNTFPRGYTFGSYRVYQQGTMTLYAIGATELPQYVDGMFPSKYIHIILS